MKNSSNHHCPIRHYFDSQGGSAGFESRRGYQAAQEMRQNARTSVRVFWFESSHPAENLSLLGVELFLGQNVGIPQLPQLRQLLDRIIAQ